MTGTTFLILRVMVLGAALVSLSHAANDTRDAKAGDLRDNGDAGLSTPIATPDPSLSPEQVVRIQMRALKQNGTGDRGIRTTYRFASPANKQVTGPYERFARMIKAAPYRAMLNAASLSFGNIRIEDTQAVQDVRVVTSDGQEKTYVFVVRRQGRPPYANCWMTDAVFSLPTTGEDEDYKRGPPGFG